jgi:hypothetical protein
MDIRKSIAQINSPNFQAFGVNNLKKSDFCIKVQNTQPSAANLFASIFKRNNTMNSTDNNIMS